MRSYLFDEFDIISPKEWKQKIQFQLDGADYNHTLLRQTSEGITIKPFYTSENSKKSLSNQTRHAFNSCQTVYVADVDVANAIALEILSKGINTIRFVANQEFDYEKLLNSIEKAHLYFCFSFFSPNFMSKISKYCSSTIIYFDVDVIGNLVRTGNWYYNLKRDFELVQGTMNTLSNSLQIDTSIYQNSGANIVQQIAYALAHSNEYLNRFGSAVIDKIYFKFSVGSDFFLEIAKFRAFKILWKLLLKEYGFRQKNTHVIAEPTLRNKMLFDAKDNLLKTYSECMSAIFGEIHTINNISFDTFFKKSNQFSSKLAREQLLFFQNNSFFSNTQNLTEGTYYIETLTEQLAQKALNVFKQIESSGGFLRQLKEGVIQQKIKESADKEQAVFDEKYNEYVPETMVSKSEIELYPFVKFQKRKTLIQPLIQKRLSEKREKELLRNE